MVSFLQNGCLPIGIRSNREITVSAFLMVPIIIFMVVIIRTLVSVIIPFTATVEGLAPVVMTMVVVVPT